MATSVKNTATQNDEPSRRQRSISRPDSHFNDLAAMSNTKNGHTSRRGQHYRNNLMWQVGLLELTNALDFPANVWNQIPTPTFAAVLMGLGGSIAILWTIFAFWDMHKSLPNIRLLREERRFLKRWQQDLNADESLETSCLVQAYLDVNFRELGWECIDRVMLDVCCGISGILVGTGALMAIRGDVDEVFLASNLLSGYIGNSFLAPFALLNAIWAVFMWTRAGGERKSLTSGQTPFDSALVSKMRHHGRKHKLYASLSGFTAIAGCVGSIMGSTLWYGYVIVAPCVPLSIYSNLLWRYSMGYDRAMISEKDDLRNMDILQTLQDIEATIRALDTGSVEQLQCFQPSDGLPGNIVRFINSLGLHVDFCYMLHGTRPLKEEAGELDVDNEYIASMDVKDITRAAVGAIQPNRRWLLYQERFLIEAYGRYFGGLEQQTLIHKEQQ